MTITEQEFKKYIEYIRNNNLADVDLVIRHGILGILSEAGEFADILKRMTVYCTPVNEEHIKEELGDLLHYMTYLMNKFGWDLADIMQANMTKLKKRYPKGYSNEDSLTRKDKK